MNFERPTEIKYDCPLCKRAEVLYRLYGPCPACGADEDEIDEKRSEDAYDPRWFPS